MVDPVVKTSEPIQIPPVTVTVIGEAGTSGAAPIPSGTVLVTPDHQPNVIYKVIAPVVAILVRFGNDWCVSFSGSMLAGGITSRVLPHTDLNTMLVAAAILATCVAGVGAVKNSATVFSGLEKRFPLASGSI